MYFLLGNSPTSELYMPTFRNTLFHLQRQAYEGGTECAETSAYTIQTPWNYPEESIQHSEHGKSLKSRKLHSASFSSQSVPAERAAGAEASPGTTENTKLFASTGNRTKIPQLPKP
jgi:hypothetical protein